MAATETFINQLLTAAFKGGTYTGGAISIGLYTDASPSTGGVEVTGGGYSRQTLTMSTPSGKKVLTANAAIFTNLPTDKSIVSYAVFSGSTIIDEGLLSSPFTADVTNNQLTVSYQFDMSGV